MTVFSAASESVNSSGGVGERNPNSERMMLNPMRSRVVLIAHMNSESRVDGHTVLGRKLFHRMGLKNRKIMTVVVFDVYMGVPGDEVLGGLVGL